MMHAKSNPETRNSARTSGTRQTKQSEQATAEGVALPKEKKGALRGSAEEP
jgi:hypothetical protein